MVLDFLARLDLPLFAKFDGSINHISPIISALAGGWDIPAFVVTSRRLPSRQLHLDTSLTLFTHRSAYNEEICELLAFCLSITPQMTRWDPEDTGAVSKYAGDPPRICTNRNRDPPTPELKFVLKIFNDNPFEREDAAIIMELLREVERSGACIPRVGCHWYIFPSSCALIAHKIESHGKFDPNKSVAFTFAAAAAAGDRACTVRPVLMKFMIKCIVDLYPDGFVYVMDVMLAMMSQYWRDRGDVWYVAAAYIASPCWHEMWAAYLAKATRRMRPPANLLDIDVTEEHTHADAVRMVAEWYERSVGYDFTWEPMVIQYST